MTQTMTAQRRKPLDPQVAETPSGGSDDSDTLRQVEAWNTVSQQARDRCDKLTAEAKVTSRAQGPGQ